MAALFGVILERAASVAGVEAAAVGMRAPLDGRPARRASIVLEDGSRLLNGDPHNFAKTPDLLRVSPRYFETLGIPLRAGRVFGDDDDRPRTPVVIVNETMVKLQWPGERAVGRRVKYLNLGASAPWAEVVGVVGDIRSESLHDPPRPEMYAPLNELSGMAGQVRIFLKIGEHARALAPRAMAALGDAHPRLRLLRVETLQDVVASSMGEQQYQAELIGMFALLALALASVGVYGLLNYAVTRRRREMAIRMALGASSSDMAALVLRRGAMLVFPGLAAGLVLASASTRVMQGLLFDISPTDPATFAVVPMLFVALAFAAGVAPTRRATSVDPAVALREE
jgi:predicted permease